MKYWPLLALILVAAAMSCVLILSRSGGTIEAMHYFMGFFLCQFALLKLFHPRDFADAFQMYDLIAKRWRLYAFVYPILELAMGLLYLSLLVPTITYILTILILGIGAIGVIRALLQGLDVRCACMGTALDVPLSTVSLTEDLAMIAMASWMLYL